MQCSAMQCNATQRNAMQCNVCVYIYTYICVCLCYDVLHMCLFIDGVNKLLFSKAGFVPMQPDL